MAELRPDTLRRLAGELRAELASIDRTVAEMSAARTAIAEVANARLGLYAAAALLDTFYTGVEKCFTRTASLLGGIPAGSAWHRTLLEDMALELPRVRPAVISRETARLLESYLGFRHRFRNLYLFDLEVARVTPLLDAAPSTWQRVRDDLEAFAGRLDALADAVGR